jgi:hypothetical protein
MVAKFWHNPITLRNAGGFSWKEIAAVVEFVFKTQTEDGMFHEPIPLIAAPT